MNLPKIIDVSCFVFRTYTQAEIDKIWWVFFWTKKLMNLFYLFSVSDSISHSLTHCAVSPSHMHIHQWFYCDCNCHFQRFIHLTAQLCHSIDACKCFMNSFHFDSYMLRSINRYIEVMVHINWDMWQHWQWRQ